MKIKKHTIDNLSAYYTKQGRLWWVEQGDEKQTFKSIEAMVNAYPRLLELEAIKMSVERRALARTDKEAVELNESEETDNHMSSITQCYYCGGVGEVAFLPCPNCHGKGHVKVTTKGLY